jgi:glucokinase
MNRITSANPPAMSDWYLGIEIGGTKLQAVSGDASGRITSRRRFSVEREMGAEGIREQLKRAIAEMVASGPPLAVGVGFGGPVDWRSGRICCSHQVGGWQDFPLGEWLHSLAQAPVFVDNDANVAALGEALHGAGAGSNPVFYVTLGSGVGGGLVVNQQIYHGAIPGESEIGHVRLDRTGRNIESSCSGWAVDRKIREAIQMNPEGTLARLAGGEPRGEARFLVPAIELGDPTAKAILDETAEDLAFGLSHVVHLCHPSVIVLGGGLALSGGRFRAAVAEALPKLVMEAFAPGPEVRLARLEEDAVPTGALALSGLMRGVGA